MSADSSMIITAIDYFSAEDVRKYDSDRRYLTRLEDGYSNSSIHDSMYESKSNVIEQRVFRAISFGLLALSPLMFNITSPVFPKLKAGYLVVPVAALCIGVGVHSYRSNRKMSNDLQSRIKEIISS